MKDYSSNNSPINDFQTVTKKVMKNRESNGSVVLFSDQKEKSLDAMIGELKLTRKALDPKDFMINSLPTSHSSTVAHWHFASEKELLKDASKNGYHLQLLRHEIVSREQAFKKAVADLCQVVFNSSEFLYVR